MRSIITIILTLEVLDIVAAANSTSNDENLYFQKASTKVIISLAVITVVIIIGLILFFIFKRKRKRPRISPRNIDKVKRKHKRDRSSTSNIYYPPPETSTKLVGGGDPQMQKIQLLTNIPKEIVKPQTRSASSTGTTTPSQVPPQTPLTPPTHHLSLSSTQTDLTKVSDKIAEIQEESYQDTSSQSPYKRLSSGPRGPRLEQQSQPTSDFPSQRTSLEGSQIRGSPSLQPVRISAQEQSDFESSSPSRASLSGEYRGSLAYGGTQLSHDVSQALQSTWATTSPETHDVYPERSATSFESTLEQESQDHPQYREPYEPLDPLQPQSRVPDVSLFTEHTESEDLGYGGEQHHQETGQRPRTSRSPYRAPQPHDPLPGAPTPPSLERERRERPSASYSGTGAPETDNPGAPAAPSPPHPLQRSFGTGRSSSRRGRQDRRR